MPPVSVGRWYYGGIIVLLCLGIWLTPGVGAGQDTTAKAEAAYQRGLLLRAGKDPEKAMEALEEALKLAPDDKYRVKVYRALLPIYRALPDVHPMLLALEFMIANSDSKAERYLKRTEVVSFAYQRGKMDLLRLRYETRLLNVPDDQTALHLLADIYDRYLPDPRRGVQIGETLLGLIEKTQKETDVRVGDQLARQYGKAGDWKQSALLYEKIAPLDKKETAHHLMSAAKAWLKWKDPDKALAAAKKSSEAPPEKRSELLTYFWHRGLADVFLEAGEPKLAIGHYEKALEHTRIEGYRRDCEGKLAEARAKAEKKDKQ